MVSFILMIIMNILSNAVCGVGKDPVCKNNGQQSNDNPTYITPDGFTFAIWGLIYIFELCYTVYQALPVQRGGKNLLPHLSSQSISSDIRSRISFCKTSTSSFVKDRSMDRYTIR